MTDYKVVAPLAYQRREGCQDARCRSFQGTCVGWHCSYCDEPCSSQGHGCDAARTLIAAALDEGVAE